jgi:hypothetical protein
MTLFGGVRSVPAPYACTLLTAALCSHRKVNAVQFPSMLQANSLPRVLQGIVIGALATMFFGFTWGGWITGGTAWKIAQQEAKEAVVAALAPICVNNFRNSANAPEKLIELNKFTVVWDRGAFVEKGGWATMPGAISPDTEVARVCANMLGRLDRLDPKSATH